MCHSVPHLPRAVKFQGISQHGLGDQLSWVPFLPEWNVDGKHLKKSFMAVQFNGLYLTVKCI